MAKENKSLELVKKINSLWVEKYRPENISDLAIENNLKLFLENCIEKNDIPNILLHGTPGTGKNSIVNVLKNNLNAILLTINASEERGIDTIREKVQSFARSASWGEKLKIVVLNEADGLNYTAQDSLRELMETASKNCRFILTCNYINRISDAIRSRTNEFELSPSQLEIAERIVHILDSENINYTKEFIILLIKNYSPDLRKMINECQKNSSIYPLLDENVFENFNNKYNTFFNKLFAENDIKKSAELIKKMIFTEDIYTALYNYIIQNLPNSDVIIAIADYSYKSKIILDKDLCFMSCLLTVKEIMKGEN